MSVRFHLDSVLESFRGIVVVFRLFAARWLTPQGAWEMYRMFMESFVMFFWFVVTRFLHFFLF